MAKYTCACCGCEGALPAEGAASSGGEMPVCAVCGWRDDASQNADPERIGPPNLISLKLARQWYQKGRTVPETVSLLCGEPDWSRGSSDDSGWGEGDNDGWDGDGEDEDKDPWD